MRSARVATLALALALAACGGNKKSSSETSAPLDQESVGSPAPAAPSEGPPNTQAPRERFIVCPGHPRCARQ